jgi:prepilin-type N-terminal cleavage/methylation domain-containing protein
MYKGVMMKGSKAFTLIELLVVIAIIALLLSIVVPTLNKAKDAARRISCGNRLKQWGIAIQMYATDNDNEIMRMSRGWGWNTVYPHYIDNEPEEYEDTVTWNIQGINPYIEAFSSNYPNDGQATDMVTCTSCSGEFMQDWIYNINYIGYDHPFAEIAYSYFGRIDLMNEDYMSPNAQEYLVGRTLSSHKLLMAEILNLDFTPPPSYRYNHGRNGWSWNEENFVNPSNKAESPNPAATGRSQLFGDIHVKWRPIPESPNLPTHLDEYIMNWNGPGSGWLGDYDTSYF